MSPSSGPNNTPSKKTSMKQIESKALFRIFFGPEKEDMFLRNVN
jgi:hypothetical protein